MCCVFTALLFLGPRIAILIWWLINPLRWSAAFDSFLWPLLGTIFLPWTTLMYVIVFTNGISIFEWIFLAFAFFIDLGAYFGGGYGNRGRFGR